MNLDWNNNKTSALAKRVAWIALFSLILLGCEDKSAWQIIPLVIDDNEGADIADVNNDGQLDVIAGRSWYMGPDFNEPLPLREIGSQGLYAKSNGDYAVDVNQDGWVDVISVSFFDGEVKWYENPGSKGLKERALWKSHLIVDTKGVMNEGQIIQDINNDGVSEFIINSWNPTVPIIGWQLLGDGAGTSFTLGVKVNGHGMGVGDINGDNLLDLVVPSGWYQGVGAETKSNQPWLHNKDWQLGKASLPILIVDLNEDGLNDMIIGEGHDYGLYWWQQLPALNGKTQWQKHLIDDTVSQFHTLHMADLDGDGLDELITGKRVFAHINDPGAQDPPILLYYRWNKGLNNFTRHIINEGTVGTGLQIRTADINNDKAIDIVVAGKSGTYVLINPL